MVRMRKMMMGKATEIVLWLLIVGLTVTGYEGCQATMYHSPATEHVRGYTRRDGSTVEEYYRRPKGVAAEDNQRTDEKEWVRMTILASWVVVTAAGVWGIVVVREKRAEGRINK